MPAVVGIFLSIKFVFLIFLCYNPRKGGENGKERECYAK